jgi:hypothetical protein
MILTFGIWCILISAAAGYGTLLIPRTAHRDTIETETVRIYSGLLILAAILLLFSFFASLALWCGLAVAAPGIVACVRNRAWRPARLHLAMYAAVALCVSLREINFYDTALYHQQAVKWLAEHGLVRGLALLYFRFGWMSSWFGLAAPLNHGIAEGRPAILGGLLPAIILVSSFRILHREFTATSAKVSALTWACFGAMIAAAVLRWNVDSSLDPDVLVWFLPLVLLHILSGEDCPRLHRIGVATIVSALACLIKATAAPALGYCFAILIWRLREPASRRGLLICGAVAIAVVMLLVGANVTTSGCPLLPSPFGCTSLPWSIGSAVARAVWTGIDQFNRSSRQSGIYPLAAGAVLASGVVIARLRTAYGYGLVWICWLGIAFALIAAPVARYHLGYLFLPIAGAMAIVLEWLTVRRKTWIVGFQNRGNALVWFTAGTAAIAGFSGTLVEGDLTALMYPRKIAATAGDPIHILNRVLNARAALGLQRERQGGLTFWVPTSSDQCWGAPLPCTPNVPLAFVSLRRAGSLDQGFIIIKPK